MTDKATLRKELRALRRNHSKTIPDSVRGLIFRIPPAPLLTLIPEGASIGLFHASTYEAPASGYAKHFSEAGHQIALPRFKSKSSEMEFAAHTDPFGEMDLEDGPLGIRQPGKDAKQVTPHLLFVPLLGFTENGHRLGQGGGHYDRWLATNPEVRAIGMAWDCQLLDEIPNEPHDMPLHAVVTPTRLFGPF